jgi:hypothetical protein
MRYMLPFMCYRYDQAGGKQLSYHINGAPYLQLRRIDQASAGQARGEAQRVPFQEVAMNFATPSSSASPHASSGKQRGKRVQARPTPKNAPRPAASKEPRGKAIRKRQLTMKKPKRVRGRPPLEINAEKQTYVGLQNKKISQFSTALEFEAAKVLQGQQFFVPPSKFSELFNPQAWGLRGKQQIFYI